MYIGKRAAVLGLQEIELDEGPLARDIPHSAFYYFRCIVCACVCVRVRVRVFTQWGPLARDIPHSVFY